jgi:hypothetical protein
LFRGLVFGSLKNDSKIFEQIADQIREYVSTILEPRKEIYASVKDRSLKKAKEEMEKHVLNINRRHVTIAEKGVLMLMLPKIRRLLRKRGC